MTDASKRAEKQYLSSYLYFVFIFYPNHTAHAVDLLVLIIKLFFAFDSRIIFEIVRIIVSWFFFCFLTRVAEREGKRGQFAPGPQGPGRGCARKFSCGGVGP